MSKVLAERQSMTLEEFRGLLQDDERIMEVAAGLKVGVDRKLPAIEVVRRAVAIFICDAYGVDWDSLAKGEGTDG